MPATPTVNLKKDEYFLALDESIVASESSNYFYSPTYRNFSVQAFSDTDSGSTAKASVEVSLDPPGGDPTHWHSLHDIGVGEFYSFSGVFSFVRVVHDSSTDPISVQLRRGMLDGGDGS